MTGYSLMRGALAFLFGLTIGLAAVADAHAQAITPPAPAGLPVSIANGGTGQTTLAAAGVEYTLATVITSASQANVTISGISGACTDLQIRAFGSSAGSVANDPLFFQFNGDTGSNYDWYQAIITNGSGSASVTTSGGSYATTSGLAGYLNGQSATVKAGVSIANLLGYSGTTFAKVVRWTATGIGTGANSGHSTTTALPTGGRPTLRSPRSSCFSPPGRSPMARSSG